VTAPKIGRVQIDMAGPAAGIHDTDRIIVDDADITTCVTTIEIPPTALGDLLRVNLGLLVLPGLRVDADSAHIGVSNRTHDLLIELGWTPPTADTTDDGPTT